MRLGVLGGTFDPIHFGHLFIAEEARCRLDLDRVLFIPNGTPPHKEAGELTAGNHRYRMTELAVKSNRAFLPSPVEIERPGRSYAVDTLRVLDHANPGAELYFITGMDTVAELPTWRQPEEILERCVFVGITRPGFSRDVVLADLPADFQDRIVTLDSPPLDISATWIRERTRSGLPIRYLTPDSVVEYIDQHGLYRF